YNNVTAFTSDSGKFEWDPTVCADFNKVDIQVDQKILFQANHTFGNLSVYNSSTQSEVTLKLLVLCFET
ncbi:26832_t:CDS:1, partial [Gigaspora margarita]